MTAEELVDSSFVKCEDLHLNVFEMAPTLMRMASTRNKVSNSLAQRFSEENLQLVHKNAIEYMGSVVRC